MNPNPLLKGINIIKVISSLNKTLNVVNKAIPVYEQIKPLIGNKGNIKSIVNIINNSEETHTKDDKKEINVIKSKKVSNNNLPTFFQ